MNHLKKVIYNCRQATFLIDKRMERKLTFRETAELRIHLIQCDVCKLYIIQSHKIDEMIKALLQGNARPVKLDEPYKENLQNRINEELNKN